MADFTQPELDLVLDKFAEATHGHVLKRADGRVARCGGPGVCEMCKVEASILEEVKRWEASQQ